MTGSFWWDLAIGIAAALLLTWICLVVALLVVRPRGDLLREALRILPDVIRLLRRLAADKTMPRGVRVRLGLLMVYLALPIDLVPDFIPVLGYADDAIIVAAVLRSIVRRAGIDAVRARWPGTEDGFAALVKIAGLEGSNPGA
ncbi:DUF1232 domain-containing protein [Nocardioides sp. KC13]|uniref:DUF1232 domain-containing protein n=1 Tax=Nocardioides turkmenicus TaxID=2711220 RepID=A0A6M1R2F7_9ACTN|nr:DUF1232 domain-containing protein [Nocardioides sp. KC13]NGN94424.1 DUF1232 domain-containing protein [Nocardioides sp. KC13]